MFKNRPTLRHCALILGLVCSQLSLGLNAAFAADAWQTVDWTQNCSPPCNTGTGILNGTITVNLSITPSGSYDNNEGSVFGFSTTDFTPTLTGGVSPSEMFVIDSSTLGNSISVSFSASVTDPIVFINYTDPGLSFDFSGNFGTTALANANLSLVAQGSSGRAASLVNGVVSQAGENYGGDGFALKLTGSYSGITFVAKGIDESQGFTIVVPQSTSSYSFQGFLSPISGADATGGSFANPIRTFKLGSTIPVKFRIFSDSIEQTTGVQEIRVTKNSSSCSDTNPNPGIIAVSSTDAITNENKFRYVYDTSGGQWIYTLDTRKSSEFTAGKYQIEALTSDGGAHYAWICLRK